MEQGGYRRRNERRRRRVLRAVLLAFTAGIFMGGVLVHAMRW